MEETPLEIIDAVDAWKDLIKMLSKERAIAIDLEHHSYRSVGDCDGRTVL